MAAIADPILRGVLFIFSAIALSLAAALAHDISSPRFNFGVFAAAFSLLFGVFIGGIAAFVSFIPAFFTAIFDFLNVVFLFTGGTAIAARIHCHSCNNHKYLDEYFPGAPNQKKDCRLGQASTAFLFFSFGVALALAIYSGSSAISGGSFGVPGRRKSSVPRTGVPTMSQV